MKNHEVSATLHQTLTYCFSLGTQPDSTVYVEATKKSQADVYIGAKVFEGRLDQCEGGNHWEMNGNSLISELTAWGKPIAWYMGIPTFG